MPRPLRIEYAGAIYHVLSRGDRREAIFLSDADRELFLETMGQACARSGWQVHAWCLMSNHFHLVLETPRPNLAAGMKWFVGTYTQRFSRRHRHWGHLFRGRYKAQLIDGRSDRRGGVASKHLTFEGRRLKPERWRALCDWSLKAPSTICWDGGMRGNEFSRASEIV